MSRSTAGQGQRYDSNLSSDGAASVPPQPWPDAPQRPRVRPGLRRLWRDADTLQLGFGHGQSAVVHDVGPAESTFLALLDGRLTVDELGTAAVAVGLEPHVALDLVRRLHAHGVLEDAASDTSSLRAVTRAERERLAPDLAAWGLGAARRVPPRTGTDVHRRRRAAGVVVHGAGRVGALAATLLAHAGIGRVDVVDPAPLRAADVPAPWARSVPADTTSPSRRQDVALDVCEQLAPSLATARRRTRGSAAPAPVVALLAPVDSLGVPALELRESLMREGTPHLLAHVRGPVGVVGPFVLPGRTPCLRCLDLVRSDRDPAWPRLLAQLTPLPAGRERGRTHEVDAGDGVLATVVAAQAVLQVLAHVDGLVPSAASATLEIDLADGATRRRAWPAHPACGCGWDADDSDDEEAATVR